MSNPDQRRFPRRGIVVDFKGRDAHGLGELVFETADLSAGGAFLKSDLLLEEDEVLTVEFSVPGQPSPLKAQARVAWVRRFPEAAEPAGMGIAFLAMQEPDRETLEHFLNT